MTLTCHPLWAVIITQPCIPSGLLNASDYVLDSYCLVGTVEAGLRKCRLGLSSCLPVVASSVGDERGSTARLRPASLRPHLRRAQQPPLAPGSGESAVQDGRAHVQSHSRNCAVIPESTASCRRSAWLTFPPLCSDQSFAGAAREAVYRRRPGLPGRWTHHLEQPAGQRDICFVSVNLPSAFKNISVPGLVPWHYHWFPVNYSPPPVDPEVILLLGPLWKYMIDDEIKHQSCRDKGRWQVTLCDPIWHVSSRSSVATSQTAIHLLLYFTCKKLR